MGLGFGEDKVDQFASVSQRIGASNIISMRTALNTPDERSPDAQVYSVRCQGVCPGVFSAVP